MKKFAVRPLAATVLATALAGVSLLELGVISTPAQAQSPSQAQKAAAAASAASAADAARPQVALLLDAARTLIQANQYTEALGKLKEAEATPDLNPYENYFITRLRGFAALGAEDAPLAAQAIESSIASGRLTNREVQDALRSLSDLDYRKKDYVNSVALARRYFKAGGDDQRLHTEVVNALYVSGDYAGAIPELQADVKADQAASRVSTEQVLGMLLSAQSKTKDTAGYEQTLELMVAHYPRADLWGDLIWRVTEKPGFADSLRLDMYRLKVATGSMVQAGEYTEMAQLALHAGYPGEAAKVLDEGFSRGLLGTGNNAKNQTQLRDQAHKQAATDAASLKQAGGSRDGNSLVNAGFALATSGQAEGGVTLMQQGLAKGGVKQPDEARLHLGVAQWMAGQKDAAVATMKTVQGTDGAADLARLWTVFAQAPAVAPAKAAGG